MFNDATALVTYKVARGAVVAGEFSSGRASPEAADEVSSEIESRAVRDAD